LERIEFKQGGTGKYGDPVVVPEHPWENGLAYFIVPSHMPSMIYDPGDRARRAWKTRY
jgi:hypothetical protein